MALGHYKMAVWLRPSVTYYQEAVTACWTRLPGVIPPRLPARCPT